MKTKEEILENNCDIKVSEVMKANEQFKLQQLITVPQALTAMQEYSDQSTTDIQQEFVKLREKNEIQGNYNDMLVAKLTELKAENVELQSSLLDVARKANERIKELEEQIQKYEIVLNCKIK